MGEGGWLTTWHPVLHFTKRSFNKVEPNHSHPPQGLNPLSPHGKRQITQLGQLARDQGQVEGKVSTDGNGVGCTEATTGTSWASADGDTTGSRRLRKRASVAGCASMAH